MRTIGRAVALSLLAVGCRSQDAAPGPSQPVVVAFTGEVDARSGTVTIWSSRGEGSQLAPHLAALSEIPVVQDGTPGSGPVDTIELVTERAATVLGGCGAVDGFEGDIRLRSFYPGAVLTNVHVELTRLTPTGREACNGVEPYGPLSNALGLWDHGTVGRAGGGFASSVRTWRFRLPDRTAFVFQGHVMADLVTSDPNPPITLAVPGAGAYPTGSTVELRCTDAETGCAVTHYTTDGSPPTTASPVYDGPIAIAEGLTLRWFSVDYWGNVEAVRSAVYDIAPRVVSIHPADGSTRVPFDEVMTVTFSKPMDQVTTAAAISLTGPGGPVAGAGAWDGEGRVFTLTPAAPLSAETSYTVTVGTSSRDQGGNTLGSDATATFTTRAPLTQQVSGPGSATLEPGGVAFDGAGKGLAVWRTRGQKILYSCYTPVSGWSASAVLDSSAGSSGFQGPRVAAGTSGFAVAWFGQGLKASVFTGCMPGPVTTLASAYYYGNHAVGSNGTGYLVVWGGTQGGSWAATFNGTSWATAQYFTSHVYPQALAVVREGTAYRVVYRLSLALYSVRQVAGVWQSPSSPGNATNFAVASQGSTVCIAWYDPSYSAIRARVESGGSGTTTGVITSGFPTGVLAAAMNNGSCQVVAGTETGARAVVYSAGSWTAPVAFGVPASPTSLGVAPRGVSDFFATAAVAGDLWVNRTVSGAWGTAQRAESSAEPARGLLVAQSATYMARVVFAQADGAADQVWSVPYDGVTVSAPERLSSMVIDGNSSGVKMAAASNGDALAIWTQEHRGRDNVFWSLRQAGRWGAPQLLASDATAAAVASNGTNFMVAYRSGISPARILVSRRFAAGSFSAPLTVESRYDGSTSEVLASDGVGYAIGYVVYPSSAVGNQPLARIFDGTGWGTDKWLAAAGSKSSRVSIAGRTGEYLLAWIDETSTTLSAMSWLAVGSGSAWSWEPTSRTIGSGTGYPAVALTAGPGGFAALYVLGTSGIDAAIMTARAWSSPVHLRTDGGGSSGPYALASNASGYLAATGWSTSGTSTRVHAWNGTWLSARDLGHTYAGELLVASDGAGYGVFAGLYSPSELVFSSVPEPIGGAIGAPVRLDTATLPIVAAPSSLVAGDDGFLAAWEQQDPLNLGIQRIYARYGL